jgi:glycerate 2-kinase
VKDLLRAIYARALESSDPERLTSQALERCGTFAPREADLLAIGKCAGGLLRGAAARFAGGRRLAIVPAGYPVDPSSAETVVGSHPEITAPSFEAGRRLQAFVGQAKQPLVFFISGGASAVAEVPLGPWFSEEEVAAANALLIRSGRSIHEINIVRKHLSAIKGGRLLSGLAGGSVTFVFSDVSPGMESDVGSGPTFPDPSTNADAAGLLVEIGGELALSLAYRLRNGDVPETPHTLPGASHHLIADNATLVAAAVEAIRAQGFVAREAGRELDGDVEVEAEKLAGIAGRLSPTEILVAGGEPQVRVGGEGIGGRCIEMALRFALECDGAETGLTALFGSSDGRDGNSGAAGAIVTPRRLQEGERGMILEALRHSDSLGALHLVGEPIMMPATGNNLRDLFLLART